MPRIETIVLACIAAAGPSCVSTWNCHPPHRDFSVDTTITEDELATLMADYGFDTRAQVECEVVCSFVYERDEGWQTGDIHHCTLDLASSSGPAPDADAATVQCDGRAFEYFCEGRRPIGHVERGSGGETLADHLTRCAELEAAAVTAFEDLIAALQRLHAPTELVERCRRARRQELEHARLVGEAARARGGAPQPPQRARKDVDRRELALDNAIEGCVHEAWAALRARWIAEHALDPELRELYAQLADDEIEHAQLSWDLHVWLLDGLDDGQGAAITAARARALTRLPERATAHGLPSALGLPDPVRLRAIAQDFADQLLAA